MCVASLAPEIVLSWYQVRPLIVAWREGHTSAVASADLSRSTIEVTLNESGVYFPGGECLSWADAARIAEAETKCFVLEQGVIQSIQAFSETTNWHRSLMPTELAPTMLVSGITMHRISGIDPHSDTLKKIKTIAPVVGSVLDTATGLGYTAIEAARTADEVITVEIDPTCLEVASLNPWSAELFNNPKITQVVADVFDAVESFEEGRFSRIVHDPPVFSLAGDLYSEEFYRQLYRVLTRRGRMFHYVGDLNSRSGRGVVRGVMRRLGEAGFSRVERRPEAFGVVATK